MKNKILSIFFALLTGISFSQTIIPGGVVTGTWTSSGSPYLVQGAIMIANATSLTIEPGVIVEFQGSYKFLVLGQLIAIGNNIDTITFTAADTSVGWLGIRFDNTLSSNDSSKFIYCRLQYGKATGVSDDKGGAFYFNNFSKAIISNSRITNCSANSAGGAIYCNNSNPTISYNIISDNTSSIVGLNGGGGGGIYSINSSQIISHNIISNNSAVYNNQGNSSGGGILCVNGSIVDSNFISNNYAWAYGGGIYCGTGSPSITNNIISNNVSHADGGGVYTYQSNAVIYNNIIDSNETSGLGGGVHGEDGSSILNNVITNNIALQGGGIALMFDNIIASDNYIANNTASPYSGGGIYCHYGNNQSISNNVISNNTAPLGGGISCRHSNTSIVNNTISNNAAQNGGALYCTTMSNPELLNTILWGNTALGPGDQVYLDDDSSDPDFTFCDIQGGSAAFGLNNNVFYLGVYSNNIDSDPLFVAPSGGSGTGFNGIAADWSLQSISPCVNTGNPIGTYPPTDIAGNPRVTGGIIDIGAYEYQAGNGLEVIVNSNSVSIYPNPFNTSFQFYIGNKHAQHISLNVKNIFGQTVFSKQENSLNNTYTKTIDLGFIPNGIYLLEVNIDVERTVKKIVKE